MRKREREFFLYYCMLHTSKLFFGHTNSNAISWVRAPTKATHAHQMHTNDKSHTNRQNTANLWPWFSDLSHWNFHSPWIEVLTSMYIRVHSVVLLDWFCHKNVVFIRCFVRWWDWLTIFLIEISKLIGIRTNHVNNWRKSANVCATRKNK